MTNFWGSEGERYQYDIFYNDICVNYTDYINNKLHWSQVFDWLFYTSYKRYLLHVLFTLLENELSISEKKNESLLKNIILINQNAEKTVAWKCAIYIM